MRYKIRSLRLLRGASYLTLAKALSAALGFLTLIMVARKLGPENFGYFSLILAYVMIIDRLFNFQSWQALIKYGSSALSRGDQDEYRGLIKLAFYVDAGTAVVATVVAVSCAGLVGWFLGWEGVIVEAAAFYSLVIAFNLSGTAFGVLRMREKFLAIALNDALLALMRFTFVLLAYLQFYPGDFGGYILIWFITEIVHKVLLFLMAALEIGRSDLKEICVVRLRSLQQVSGKFLQALLATNLEGVVRILREADIFIVSTFLGAAGAGHYRVAKQFGQLVAIYVEPVYHVIYPELAQLASQRKYNQFRVLCLRSGFYTGLLTVLGFISVILIGPYIIPQIMGKEFNAVVPLLNWILAAMCVWSFAFPVSPALMALDQFQGFLRRNILATLLYFPLFCFAVYEWGLNGAGVAFFLFYLFWSGLMLKFVFGVIQSRQ